MWLIWGEKVAEKIRDCVILDTLELRGNTLGVDATIPIADALESRPELRRALWSDLFTGRLKEEIPRTLVCFGLFIFWKLKFSSINTRWKIVILDKVWCSGVLLREKTIVKDYM